MFKVLNEVLVHKTKKKAVVKPIAPTKLAKIAANVVNLKDYNLINDTLEGATDNSIASILSNVHKDIQPLVNAEFIKCYKIQSDALVLVFNNRCELSIIPCNKSARYIYRDAKRKVLFDDFVANEKHTNN
jgi:hypothetical protein